MTTSTSTVAPVSTSSVSTSTVAPARKPVDVAFDRLSLSNIQNLWNDKVANNSSYLGLGKIFGLLSYLWNRSDAATKDKAHGATIELFNQKLAACVQALSKRGLTDVEATKLGLGSVRYTNGEQRRLDGTLVQAANDAEKEFYDVFKTRCQQLNVDQNSNDFFDFAKAATKGLKNHAKQNEGPDLVRGGCLLTKIKTAAHSFNGKIFDDMIKAYGSQDVATLTPAAFIERKNKIHAFFPQNNVLAIGDAMKAAVLAANPANRATATTLGNEYLDVAPNNPQVAALATSMQTELEAERDAIHAKMNVLIGSTGWNGTINDAQTAVNNAAQALQEAFQEFQTAAAGGATLAGSTLDQVIAVADLSAAMATDAVRTAHAKVIEKNTALKAANDAKAALVAELNELATWHNGNINGGKIHDVTTKLANIGGTARNEATARGNFFRWLSA